MIEFSGVLVAISALSLTVSRVVTLLRNLVDPDGKLPSWTANTAALVVGLAFALGWQLNVAGAIVALIPALAAQASTLSGVSGQVLTGIVIGMAAGFWHEVLSALASISTKNEAIAKSQ
jgi:hypothetical protein